MTAELWLTRAENLMKFIDVAIPKFGDDEPDNSPQRIAPPTQSRSLPAPAKVWRSVPSAAANGDGSGASFDARSPMVANVFQSFAESRTDCMIFSVFRLIVLASLRTVLSGTNGLEAISGTSC